MDDGRGVGESIVEEKSETGADQPRTDQEEDTRGLKQPQGEGKRVSCVDALMSSVPEHQGKTERRVEQRQRCSHSRNNPTGASSVRLFLLVSLLGDSGTSASRIQVLDDAGTQDVTTLFLECFQVLI